MENLEIMVRLLYKRVPVQQVIEEEIEGVRFDREEFLKMASAYIFYYSENETVNLLDYYLDRIYRAAKKNGRQIPRDLNVFEFLFCCAQEFLTIQNNEVVCRYSKLLDWRQMTVELSEDLIISAFLAGKEMYAQMLRMGFSWKRVIGHDNVRLNAVVRRGISENHSHLYGAAPIFHISWLSLMNNMDVSKFGDLLCSYDDDRRYANVAYISGYKETSFHQKYLQAVLIRLLLYSKLSEKRLKIGEYIVDAESLRGLLAFPPLQLGVGGHEPRLNKEKAEELKQLFKNEGRQGYPLQRVVRELIRLFCSFVPECAREQKLDEIWRFNPEFAETVHGPLGDYRISCVQVDKALDDCLDAPVSVFFLRLVQLVGRVSLDDVQGLFKDGSVFQEIWDNITLKNVKVLLKEPHSIVQEQDSIQSTIDTLRLGDFRSVEGIKVLDYALNDIPYIGADQEKDNFIFSGERWILYRMMRKIYLRQAEFSEYFNLFYAYLLIKESIRSEIVQSNKNVGFRNFQKYQNRKWDLLADIIYENVFTKMAVSDSLISENICKIEVRITSCTNAEENCNMIQRLDRLAVSDEKWKEKLFYTVHFLKGEDGGPLNAEYVHCRHYERRKDAERRAFALAGLREEYPRVAERILGIDAAANEIGCRPEVFAPVFRYLKDHRYSHYTVNGMVKAPQLRATYHVGEDFLDVADGLRAIEEAVLFLNLGSGDRMGHALALGIDPGEWYEGKGYKVILPIQDYLDNLVWVYHKIFQYNIQGFENLKELIQSEFSRIFMELYCMNISQGEIDAVMQAYIRQTKADECPAAAHIMMNMGIFNYYRAWQLRGDDPELYEFGYFDEEKYTEKQEGFRVNFQYPREFDIRRIPEIALIYYMYHYNRKIREKGKHTIEISVSKNYVDAVIAIQKALQKEIAKRGIGIETNPSSNILIGTFRQYDKHPILQFYNKGMVYDEEKLKNCPQLSVSINTDDQGVFSTSLENEYALTACALETLEDENGLPVYNKVDVYEWLDKIRIMGNEQNFANLLLKNEDGIETYDGEKEI